MVRERDGDREEERGRWRERGEDGEREKKMELETRWGEKKMRKDLSPTSFPSPTLSPLSPLSLSAPCFLLTPHLSLHHPLCPPPSVRSSRGPSPRGNLQPLSQSAVPDVPRRFDWLPWGVQMDGTCWECSPDPRSRART